MGVDLKNITENYRERIQRLALFDTLYKLDNKKSKDNSDKLIDYFSLGLLTLLFFFENMLVRNKKTGVKELAVFLIELNQGEIDLEPEGFEKIARTIIGVFRPSTGKRNTKSFYNWETRTEESVQYSILKADKADLTTNTQYYTLDDQGLELIFATKEYFNEFQLSINQLVLRKQLEKGEFVGALRQIDEMSLDVKNLQDRMFRIKHEIQRNIVSNETFERYKIIIEDINMRLYREDEEFDELQSFARETKEKIGNDMSNEKDRKTYELILQIDRELDHVHYEHRLLLKESIILKTSALQAAQESLYYVGIDSFNFDQEITSRVFSSPLPLSSTRTLIEPFLYLEKQQSWSPLTVFSPQRLEARDKLEKSSEFFKAAGEEERKVDLMLLRGNFKRIMEVILVAMKGEKEITIEAVAQDLRLRKLDEFLLHRNFYDFWVILHQKSPIIIDDSEKSSEDLFGEVLTLLQNKGKVLKVDEIEGVLKITDRYTIRNMKLRLEDGFDNL
ncbi:replicative DNA helicase [Clostridium sp. CS001]|uniref:replicative DNA helicase n=1 Tax=Clostridium sp. CS001 TaxID=2880648 RepID=UPI001CF1863A|nr:replicative DNA helicase [Clostridium sp. CS001]MCB2291672.1 replicative DNA helicase [Clostridium sp. CS001]